ncbi:hypothetical protein [Nonomuraea sp. NPDC049695]|uniref:hypothetical protein n=1 Tax=Nonomuraea sp. NPDC049695 TaxID=3154734 RepID=UPI003440A934
MTQPPDEHGDLLRRALRAEADAVVPSPDGLEIIRARIERRGVRNLFWWRAGAAAASAVLVAGTIVMAVPQLRTQIINSQPVENDTSRVPSNSSTTRSQEPPPPSRQPTHDQHPIVVPDVTKSPTPRPSKRAESTSRPSPTPTPTPTTCPTTQAEQADPPSECPSVSPTPSPTPPAEDTLQPTTCPVDECPPDDNVTETPADVTSPLVDASHTTP